MEGTRELLALSEVRRMCATGEALRIRTEAHLTLPPVASVVGVAVATVWRWEHAERLPTGRPALRYGRLLRELRQEST